MSEVIKYKAGVLRPSMRVVLLEDYDSALVREAALQEELVSIKASIDGYDSPEHAAQVADTLGHQVGELQSSLNAANKLLLDWYSANAEGRITVADSAYSIVSATSELLSETDIQPAAELTHICPGCGAKGWTARCGQCVPF